MFYGSLADIARKWQVYLYRLSSSNKSWWYIQSPTYMQGVPFNVRHSLFRITLMFLKIFLLDKLKYYSDKQNVWKNLYFLKFLLFFMITYIYNFLFRNKILFRVFRSIIVTFQIILSNLLDMSYNFLNFIDKRMNCTTPRI